MSKAYIASAIALTISTLAGGAYAGPSDCKLSQIAAMDMIREPDGKIAVAAGINGAQHRFLIATSHIDSAVLRDFAQSAQIPQKHLARNVHIHTLGGEAETYGTVDKLTLGSGSGSDLRMVVAPGSYPADPDVVGTLGTDILGNFDVDFDFAAAKIRLFSSDHCPTIGAYWATTYAELPIDLEKLGKPISQWTLDGHTVTVSFDTSAAYSNMPLIVAKDKFGLEPGTPGVEPAGNDDEGNPVYRYRFRSLTADGIAINNPLIGLRGSPTQNPCDGKKRMGPHWRQTVTCYGEGDLSLGLAELSKLHLYFAYKDRVIYFTAADAH